MCYSILTQFHHFWSKLNVIFGEFCYLLFICDFSTTLYLYRDHLRVLHRQMPHTEDHNIRRVHNETFHTWFTEHVCITYDQLYITFVNMHMYNFIVNALLIY